MEVAILNCHSAWLSLFPERDAPIEHPLNIHLQAGAFTSIAEQITVIKRQASSSLGLSLLNKWLLCAEEETLHRKGTTFWALKCHWQDVSHFGMIYTCSRMAIVSCYFRHNRWCQAGFNHTASHFTFNILHDDVSKRRHDELHCSASEIRRECPFSGLHGFGVFLKSAVVVTFWAIFIQIGFVSSYCFKLRSQYIF